MGLSIILFFFFSKLIILVGGGGLNVRSVHKPKLEKLT